MDPNNATDVKAAKEMQDAVRIEQKNGPGKFEVPNWNSSDVARLREALEIDHLLGTAAGWGGNPASAASEFGEFYIIF